MSYWNAYNERILVEICSDRIYYWNNADFDEVYIYCWNTEGGNNAAWPGEKMTLDHTNSSGQDIYTFEVSADVQYLIFSNKSSQTVNIPFDGTELKFYAKSTTDSSGKYEYGTW